MTLFVKSALLYIGYVWFIILLTYLHYIAVMYLASKRDKLSYVQKTFGFYFLFQGLVFDLLLNFTVLPILIGSYPRLWTATKTLRCVQMYSGWRGSVARWIINSWLNPLDPKGNHCPPCKHKH